MAEDDAFIGRIFGRLTVVGSGSKKYYLECVCTCGNTKQVYRGNLNAGNVKSCGYKCPDMVESRQLIAKQSATIHGLHASPTYRVWEHMHGRCYNPETHNYAAYGGRGIRVHSSWFDLETFYRDVGERPSANHSFDRIDTNKDYSPDNWRWATAKQQARNRRSNLMLTFKGETRTLAEWCELLDHNYQTISSRITTYKWSAERALKTPTGKRRTLKYKE